MIVRALGARKGLRHITLKREGLTGKMIYG
jgi:hypothetical protein